MGSQAHGLGGRDVTAPLPEDPLPRTLRNVAVRVGLQRALDGAVYFGIGALVLAGLGIGLTKLGEPALGRLLLAWSAALPWAGALLGAVRPVPRLFCAQLLDRAHHGEDLLSSAHAFSLLAPEQQTPFMHACRARARVRAPELSARLAQPLRLPPGSWVALVLGAAVALLWLVRPPAQVALVASLPPKVTLLSHEDLQAFAAETKPLLAAAELDPQVREAALGLNALLEAMNEGALDRAAALAALRELEQRFGDQQALARDELALREALQELGRALDKSPLAEPVSEALRAADAAAARRELERLAERVEQPPTRAESRESLERALDRAAKTPESASARELATRREELQRLLRRREESKRPDERQERLLQRKQRELEKLERSEAERQRASRELDALRRELGAAGQSLRRSESSAASRSLKQGARSLQQIEQKQMSAKQREQLKERLSQLRELIRRRQDANAGKQKQAGKSGGKPLSLEEFGKAARGGQGTGKPDQGDEGGAGNLLVPGSGESPDALMLGEQQQIQSSSAETLLMPGGTQAGRGGRPELAPEGTRLQTKTEDTHVQGESREGPTRSEVIREAGQHGFASRPYEQVHAEYQRHAEAVIEREEVPGGYRFYVRRYFQLIRPRDGIGQGP